MSANPEPKDNSAKHSSNLTETEKARLMPSREKAQNARFLEIMDKYYGKVTEQIVTDPNRREEPSVVSGTSNIVVKARSQTTPDRLKFALQHIEGIFGVLNITYTGNEKGNLPFKTAQICIKPTLGVEVITEKQGSRIEKYSLIPGGRLDDEGVKIMEGVLALLSDYFSNKYEPELSSTGRVGRFFAKLGR